jgi:hypothetical protein
MLISPSIPFPPISWWTLAFQVQHIGIDVAEFYQKMSYRNRYYLAGPQGKQLLSIPLEAGRNQRQAMAGIRIDFKDNWQSRHWKTIVSLYGRSPFFEYFEYKMRPLYEGKLTYLHEWNQASIKLASELLDWKPSISIITSYIHHYEQEKDIRNLCTPLKLQQMPHPSYYQVFQDRTGFIPNCSILDILFCEGKRAAMLLRNS